MAIVYDSGWVPVASGTINANVNMGDATRAQVFIAASGAAGAGTTAMGWAVGAGTPVPWNKRTPAYSCTPLMTGTYTVAAPGAGATLSYYLGYSMSGANHIDDWVPQVLNVSTVAGAASFARVIVSAK